MILDLFKNLRNNLKNNNEDVQKFLNELKNAQNIEKNNKGILDKVQEENKISIGTKNQMEAKMDEILKEYQKETADKGDLYFIVEKAKDNTYTTYKYEIEDDDVLKLVKEELPQNAGVNTALRYGDGKYIIDEEGTKELQNRIKDMAEELIDEQNRVLEEYRKEGHSYRVSENINNCVFLWDITDKPKVEVEEVDFPEELLDKAIEGAIFDYVDGTYELKE